MSLQHEKSRPILAQISSVVRPGLVFVTGATGFVGSHFLKLLCSKGVPVAALCRDLPPAPTARIPHPQNIEWVKAERAQQWIADHRPTAVVHFATDYGRSTEPSACLEANVSMPLRLLEAAEVAGVELFLNTDTFFGKPGFNDAYLLEYRRSKAIFLEWGRRYASSRHIRFLTLRLEHVYGEHDGSEKFVPWLISRLLMDGEAIALTSGAQCRDFIHVADVAQAFLTVMAAYRQLPAEVSELEVGTGRAIPLREFVLLAHQLSGSTARLLFDALPQRKNEIASSQADIRAMNALGWMPAIALEEGVARNLKPFLDHHD